ncbi:hypothetical protein QE152_g13939 [Popillia japonica]|uniref:Uncharacterized protein n=1 Tax=Popillia japonica TaxID=7064 RepID=A0AAW1LB31_POPJA
MMLWDRFIIEFGKGAMQSKLFKEAITRAFAEVIEVAVAEMAVDVPSTTASNFASVPMDIEFCIRADGVSGPSCYIEKYEESKNIYVIKPSTYRFNVRLENVLFAEEVTTWK